MRLGQGELDVLELRQDPVRPLRQLARTEAFLDRDHFHLVH